MLVCAIPIDDGWTAQWYISFNAREPLNPNWMTQFNRDAGDPDHFNADMGDVSNLWHQDRAAMKQGHWSGIVDKGNAYEDFAVQESMGPIVDRSKEFLGTCDVVIVRAFYKYIIITPLITSFLAGHAGNTFNYLTASAAFRNEPFGSNAC